MQRLRQSPTDPAFVQDPYPFYDRARAAGDLFFWEDYAMVCATSHTAVHALLRMPEMGRECPPEEAPARAAHLAPFYALEAHSMLESEPPRHTRLRGLVARAFTSAQIASRAPEIAALAHALIDAFPPGPVDLLPAYACRIPVIMICRLLGVPEAMADQLLAWSHAMVAMYQAGRSRAVEEAAGRAAAEFAAFMRAHVEARRGRPGGDLLTRLIAAEEAGDRLSTDELISTAILLLNAGHEATVHSLGNAVKTLLAHGRPSITDAAVEECLRFDPPLHLFTRHAHAPVRCFGHDFRRGDAVGLLLAAANRDPARWDRPGQFRPDRPPRSHHAFGGGIHFCIGAPLARLEIATALRVLFERLPDLRLAAPPRYAPSYHFHGLEALLVAPR